MSAPDCFDFAILGSGFSSSVLSMVLQRLGYRCVMIDRATHPRFMIGESSTPIADQILLDLAEDFDLPYLGQLARWATARQLPNVTVGCKRGFSYFFHQPEQRKSIPGSLLVPASPDTASADSHWLRSEVDHALANEAVATGVSLLQGTAVMTSRRNDGRWLLTCQSDKKSIEIQAGFLFDSSGTANNLNCLLNLQRESRPTETRTGCVYAHFQKNLDWQSVWERWGLESSEFSFPPQLAAMHHVVDDGWMWHLGFDDTRISLGWVLDLTRSQLPDSDQLQVWWQDRLNRFPKLKGLYGDAEPLRPLTLVSRLQRMTSVSTGNGWLALPAATGFIDPLHSTGIAHSMTAVQKIAIQLKRVGQLDDAFLDSYGTGLQKEFWLLDQLTSAAYRSLGDPEKWEAATMVYFASAIAFEEARNRRRVPLSKPHSNDTVPLFLMANDPIWLDRVVRAKRLLNRKQSPPGGWLLAMADVLGAYNHVGLCDPECRGIYRYTVAEK